MREILAAFWREERNEGGNGLARGRQSSSARSRSDPRGGGANAERYPVWTDEDWISIVRTGCGPAAAERAVRVEGEECAGVGLQVGGPFEDYALTLIVGSMRSIRGQVAHGTTCPSWVFGFLSTVMKEQHAKEER